MESYNSNQIKDKYQNFSEKQGFKFYQSGSVIADENSKLLFNISGGVKYQDELLELKPALEPHVSSIQKCIRTDNLDNVGVSGRHHIFFEMLGHFDFYSSNEQEAKERFIKFAYDFLTKEIGLEQTRIYTTVHKDDSVTSDIWKSLGNTNIIYSDNNIFVSPYADKSSFRTEILWQKNDEQKSLIELWNLVFTQFNSKNILENPSFTIGADSGASLERIVSAYENKNNNYDNSMWYPFVEKIGLLGNTNSYILYQRIADLANASVELVKEELRPGNKAQSYMLRKMMRMLFESCEEAHVDLKMVLDLITNDNKIKNIFIQEKIKYINNLKNALRLIRKKIKKNEPINLDYTYLKSTYGLPDRYINCIMDDIRGTIKVMKNI